MSKRLPPLDRAEVPSASEALLDPVAKALGMIPNLHLALARAPAALAAYVGTTQALGRGRLDPAHRERIAVATAAMNRCRYCASAHAALGEGAGLSSAEIQANLEGRSNDPRAGAMLALVRALVDGRGEVPDAVVAAAREAGFGDEELVEIVAHVGMNVFTNMFNVFARTPIDFPEVSLPASA